jgi:hypothetical protein
MLVASGFRLPASGLGLPAAGFLAAGCRLRASRLPTILNPESTIGDQQSSTINLQ